MKKHLNRRSIYTAPPKTGRLDIWDSAPGFGLRITPNGTRTYTVMGRLDGKLIRRTLGSPPAEGTPIDRDDEDLGDGVYWPERARALAGDWRQKIAAGIDPAPPELKTSAPANDAEIVNGDGSPPAGSFGDVVIRYLADTGRGAGGLRTKDELARKFRVDCGAWTNRPMESITTEIIEDLVDDKHAEAPGGVANQLLSAIKGVFRYAKRRRLIARNPAAEVEAPSRVQKRDRVLTLDELHRIWLAADEMAYPFGRITQLLILTAQRRSEVTGLEWREIDGGAWRLPDARAKRGQGHVVPLSPLARAIINETPKDGNGVGAVFTTTNKTPVSGWSKAKKKLDRTIAIHGAKAAGIENPTTKELESFALDPWRIHDIRRSVASAMRDGDIMGDDRVEDRIAISKLLNHAEAGVTFIYDRYAADPEQRKAVEAWTRVVERGFTPARTADPKTEAA